MPTHVQWAPVLLAALAIGCAAPAAQMQQKAVSAAPALSSLRSGSFDDAGRHAEQNLGTDPNNPYARLTRAIVRYKTTMHQLSLDVRTVVIGGVGAGALNHRYLQSTFDQAERDLAAVEDDLAHAAARPGVAVELCVACWEIDWNGNGRVDERDRLLMQIEVDADGKAIPKDDPRRKPTFRFDDGDLAWARAFVAFQRAALDVVLAYDLNGVDALLGRRRDLPARIVLKLSHPERIAAARQRILDGLEQSERSRRLYLAETDDDREWVPNPRQKDHPLPLPVDAALYETWEGVVGDLKRIVQGKEGLSVADLAQLGDHTWESPPRGYIDLGGMLAHPKDIVIEPGAVERFERPNDKDVETALASVLGDYYRKDMKASPLPGRLRRMKGEVDRREESIERKLRYLFWIN